MFEPNSGPVMIVAPHPDDETLGAGGFLLRAIEAGVSVHWLVVTGISVEHGWAQEKVARREQEISAVADAYGFAGVHRLNLPSAKLETIPMGEMVSAIGTVVKSVEPTTLLVPHRGDAHSDHHVVYEATTACTKWFRYPSIKWTLVYETLSETDAGLFNSDPFLPNLYIDISSQLEKKLHITSMFGDEIGGFPFPRSLEAVGALAKVRGAASGYTAAEAFMLLRGRT
ncbi:PIG-L deacetylase family protein [Sinorhizobium mexicanum]|uniref:PIG-L family deacetylase n=1 Tax=Sinorhizobium mexicanum TaxID=375549 RepID=A0A859QQI5_9HYPH|nr:PIG-L deacetylase family protein [Sinorhizobium mexicanum]MBP1888126.1 LmbE family N-acetylglucosaminyl deacetylase [Sinorhizobium mexicanum]QLL65665.1 PIG-L family deacetylase [Sinorhizobium mexicanum]